MLHYGVESVTRSLLKKLVLHREWMHSEFVRHPEVYAVARLSSSSREDIRNSSPGGKESKARGVVYWSNFLPSD